MKTMKSILMLCVGLLFISNCFAQSEKIEWIKKDAKLTYDVNTKKANYLFMVSITNTKPDLAFNFEMTDANKIKGNVNMSEEALKNAVKFNNYFRPGELLLTDMTTVWVSKKVYSYLKKGQEIMVDFGDGEEGLKFKGNEKMSFKINDSKKEYNVLLSETESGKKMWVLDNAENPLILKMDLGWSIEIKSVEFK
ncbi:MAG: hypothetical protein HXX09_07815 [Bacteroidetes bacterium]|nr:hypothetical protein [Bacteroidota bacterium]